MRYGLYQLISDYMPELEGAGIAQVALTGGFKVRFVVLIELQTFRKADFIYLVLLRSPM